MRGGIGNLTGVPWEVPEPDKGRVTNHGIILTVRLDGQKVGENQLLSTILWRGAILVAVERANLHPRDGWTEGAKRPEARVSGSKEYAIPERRLQDGVMGCPDSPLSKETSDRSVCKVLTQRPIAEDSCVRFGWNWAKSRVQSYGQGNTSCTLPRFSTHPR